MVRFTHFINIRSNWKVLFLLCAVLIGLSSLWFTNNLVVKLSEEERKKIEFFAEIYKLLNEADASDSNLDFYLHVMENNTTIPVIITDENQNIMFSRNIENKKITDPNDALRRIEQMNAKKNPIILNVYEEKSQYVYYDDSYLLYLLSYYPYIQFGIVFLFIGASYIVFNISRKSEQNRVWVGLSKETAHQLGTPLSSLLAITEMLKMQLGDSPIIVELEKDIERLNFIAERFSKISSIPAAQIADLGQAIGNSLNYIRKRTSDKINICYEQPDEPVMVPLSETLFGWVIENICKNALDAMSGAGTINIELKPLRNQVIIDISDTGKGISKRRFDTIFKPGYTTKSRGWGLGLSLVKRIVEQYHNGRIFVLRSEIDKGTTFRIILKSVIHIKSE